MLCAQTKIALELTQIAMVLVNGRRLEMHGVGTFCDPRLDDANRFPIAAANGFGDLRTPRTGSARTGPTSAREGTLHEARRLLADAA
jgi:hypothetical protein